MQAAGTDDHALAPDVVGRTTRDDSSVRTGVVVVQALDAGRLRDATRDDVRARRTCWLPMEGAALGDPDAHRGFVHHAAAGGVVPGVEDAPAPEAVVFDWSRTGMPAAEAAAYFAVVLQRCGEGGISRRYVVLPERTDASVVVEAACGPELNGRSTDGSETVRRACRLLASTGPIPCSSLAPVARFMDELSRSLVAAGAGEPGRRAVAIAQEVIGNVFGHAAASRMCAVALLFTRRRPAVIQVGVADDGRGIPRAVLDRAEYRGFGLLHDASVLHAVVARQLTERASDGGADADGRGGLGAMLGEQLPALGAVRVRSGAALVSAARGTGWRRAWLDHGYGSQFVVEVPVEA